MITQVMSLLGTAMVLTAYYMVTYRQMRPTALFITTMNVCGSLILLTVALLLFNTGFMLLNVAWIVIAVISYRKARNVRPDEVARTNG